MLVISDYCDKRKIVLVISFSDSLLIIMGRFTIRQNWLTISFAKGELMLPIRAETEHQPTANCEINVFFIILLPKHKMNVFVESSSEKTHTHVHHNLPVEFRWEKFPT